MNSANRAEINRQNAAHSTGPVTTSGKQRASLNALRHGLTGQTIVLPSDDLAAYHESCRVLHSELKPVRTLETNAVQTIADTYWRLNRIRAMENNLFSLGFQEQSSNIHTDDPAIHCALAQAKAVKDNAELLARLSLYEQRLNRTLAQARADLKQLQQERREAEQEAFKDADRIRKLKKALGQPWQPQDTGFEFSTQQLSVWSNRRQLKEQAEDLYYRNIRPLPETKQ
jgi:hypothetical protein